LWNEAAVARNLSLTFIASAYRGISPAEAAAELRNAQALAKLYPQAVRGFDLVGQEGKGRPLIDFVDTFTSPSPPGMAPLPLVLHAGETKGAGTATDGNLYDALLLGTARIGHGFSLRSHPALRQHIKAHNIGVEVCLISNQVLGLVDDVRNHPLPLFLSEGLPVVLSSDDPGFWGAEGVAYDWVLAFMVVDETCSGLATLKQLALNSIEQALLEPAERDVLLGTWRDRWGAYVSKVVASNGPGI